MIKHGSWKQITKNDDGTATAVCSRCKSTVNLELNKNGEIVDKYCKLCSACMDGKEPKCATMSIEERRRENARRSLEYYHNLPEYARKRLNRDRNKHMREIHDERQRNGLCVSCGKKPAMENHLTCIDCAIKRQQYNKKKRAMKHEQATQHQEKVAVSE